MAVQHGICQRLISPAIERVYICPLINQILDCFKLPFTASNMQNAAAIEILFVDPANFNCSGQINQVSSCCRLKSNLHLIK